MAEIVRMGREMDKDANSAREPTMNEIFAAIRELIARDDSASETPPKPTIH